MRYFLMTCEFAIPALKFSKPLTAQLLVVLCSLFFASLIQAADSALTDNIQDLKQKVIELNRDLFILEEDLLFPANTQFAVFLSVDVGEFFALDSVELKIDGETVTHYLYTARQVHALHKGGVQRLYVGNLKSGVHELTAFFTGLGPNNRDYKRGTTYQFRKSADIKSLELQISDSTRNYQPEFSVHEWD
jgi:hypothetical protein